MRSRYSETISAVESVVRCHDFMHVKGYFTSNLECGSPDGSLGFNELTHDLIWCIGSTMNDHKLRHHTVFLSSHHVRSTDGRAASSSIADIGETEVGELMAVD
jgi:hypothetical protein